MTDIVTRLRGLSRHEHDDLTIGDEAADVIERMSAWMEGECWCPCCDQTRACVDACTFDTDCPDESERMAGAREALYGPKP